MPELPEVESIRLQLNKFIVGHKILNVAIHYEKCFRGDKKQILGSKINTIRRFGKALVIDLSNNFSIVIHVKMTGQLIYRGMNLKNPKKLSEKVKGGLEGKHNHVTFVFDKNSKLYYVDYRKFGWIKIIATKDVEKTDFVGKLGPEPQIDSINQSAKTLGFKKFSEILSKNKRSVKLVIMDQEKISGVGNIYANDALFMARIDPQKKASELRQGEQKKLFDSVKKVLKVGIKSGGASELAFVTPDGTEGNYQKKTLVYGKEGEKCSNGCGGTIKKIKLGGRGTYFCPDCQK